MQIEQRLTDEDKIASHEKVKTHFKGLKSKLKCLKCGKMIVIGVALDSKKFN